MKIRSLLLCAALAVGTTILHAQERRPVISFESQAKDVGKVTGGETIKQTFKFANKGDATLEIYKVEPS